MLELHGNFGDMNHELNGDIYVKDMGYVSDIFTKKGNFSNSNKGTYDLISKKGD